MKQPLNTLRLFVEIVATVIVAELLVVFALPGIAPGVTGAAEAVLNSTLLSILAGAVILWRVYSAIRRAGMSQHITKAAGTGVLLVGSAGVLALGLAATVAAVVSINRGIDHEARTRFEQHSERLLGEARSRVTQPRYGLTGARGVYSASKSVERGEFATYVASHDLPKEFPGAIGFGVIQRVMRPDLDAFIAAERADDAPDFAVWGMAPPGSRLEQESDLYVIKHCFPKERNARAWGLDIGSEPIRREAAERAARSGEPAITRRITLVQDDNQRTGFLYFLPVYRNGTNPTTPEERMAALTGLIYAPIILDEALAGVADTVDGLLDLEIFQGDQPSADGRLYDLYEHLAADDEKVDATDDSGRMFKQTTAMTIGGQTWTFCTSTTPAFHATVDRTIPAVMGIGGATLSVLLAGIVWMLGTARARAMRLAQGMTSDLAAAKASAERLAEIARRTSNGVIITDAKGCIEWVNEGFTRITGYALGEVKGMKPGSFLQGPGSDPAASRLMGGAVRRGEGCSTEIVNYGKDGREYTLAIEIMPLRDETGVLTGFMAIESDVTEHRAAGEVLRVEGERLEMAASAAQMGLWDWNPQTGYVRYDQRWAEMLGYNLAELRPHVSEWSDRVHPDDLPVAMKAVQEAMLNNTPYSCETRLRHRNGSWRWILDQGRVVTRNERGEVTRFVGSHIDITERKRIELELSRATAMLQRTGELAKVGGWSVDLETMKLSWTLQTFRIAEIEPPNEPDLETGINLFAPEARPAITAAVRAAMDSGTPFDLELPLITAKGQHRWVKTQGYAEMHNGKAIRLYGTFQDTTESRQAKMELLEITERFKLAIRAGGVGTWEYRVLDNKLSWDDQMFRLYGTTREQFSGAYDAWATGLHPEDRARGDHEIEQALRGEKPFDTEFRVVWPDGSTHHIRAIATVQHDEAGRPVRMVGTNWDVTEQKSTQARLLAANNELEAARHAAEAANRSKSEFLANMSHEIRTPLTAILGFADLLKDDGNIAIAPEHRVQHIDTIKNAGAHLLTVINDILDLSKIEAHRMTIETISTPLIEILREIERLTHPRAKGKGLTLTTTLATPVPERIMADPTRLRQILMNLAGNAVKFTETGSVTITAGVDTGESGPRLTIDVEDTGPGLTREQADRLFQAFGQADESVTRKHGGTGLGLTICRRLASLMGGDVKLLRTEPGRGSCFRLVLPLAAAPGAAMVTRLDVVTAPNAPAANNSATTLAGRILLAEDGPDNQRLISFHLRKAGAEVTVADNGRIALELIEKAAAGGTPFDLLLTDMQMPEMDGYTLSRTLRSRGSTLAIVAITAHAMAEDRARCVEAGCDDYATKPIDKAALLATCSEWIGKAGGVGTRAQAA